MRLDINIEKGKEAEIVRSIQVANPDTKSLHVIGSVTGPIAQFITLEPSEFDLPAGPGIMSTDPRPYNYVRVIIRVPREVPETKYTGEILFSEVPVSGGVLATSAQLGVKINLSIGNIAEAVFPVYINVMIFLLIILLLVSIITTYRRKRRKE